MRVSRWAKRSWHSYRTALHSRGSFYSDSPQRFSHMIIPKQKPTRVFRTQPEPGCNPRHMPISRAPHSKWTHFKAFPFFLGIPPTSLGLAALLHWMTPGDHLCHSRFRIWTTAKTLWASQGGGASAHFLLELKRFSLSYNQQNHSQEVIQIKLNLTTIFCFYIKMLVSISQVQYKTQQQNCPTTTCLHKNMGAKHLQMKKMVGGEKSQAPFYLFPNQ